VSRTHVRGHAVAVDGRHRWDTGQLRLGVNGPDFAAPPPRVPAVRAQGQQAARAATLGRGARPHHREDVAVGELCDLGLVAQAPELQRLRGLAPRRPMVVRKEDGVEAREQRRRVLRGLAVVPTDVDEAPRVRGAALPQLQANAGPHAHRPRHRLGWLHRLPPRPGGAAVFGRHLVVWAAAPRENLAAGRVGCAVGPGRARALFKRVELEDGRGRRAVPRRRRVAGKVGQAVQRAPCGALVRRNPRDDVGPARLTVMRGHQGGAEQATNEPQITLQTSDANVNEIVCKPDQTCPDSRPTQTTCTFPMGTINM